MDLPFIIGIVVAVTGIGVFIRGVVGRGGTTPRCRGCGYRVTDAQARGELEPGVLCPECGRPLAGRGITDRRIRPGLIAAGVLVFSVGLAAGIFWPSAAWRWKTLPQWWLIRVEAPIATPAERGEIRRLIVDRVDTVPMSDLATRFLVDALVADLDRIDAGETPAGVIGDIEPIVDDLVDDGEIVAADVTRLQQAAMRLSLQLAWSPPDGLEVTWGIGREGTSIRQPRVFRARAQAGAAPAAVPVIVQPAGAPPRPGAAAIPVIVQPVALRVAGASRGLGSDETRINGRVVSSTPRTWRAHDQPRLLPPTSTTRRFSRVVGAIEGLAPGVHRVELDLEVRAGDRVWTRTLRDDVTVTSWPPPGYERITEEVFRGLMAEPPTVRVATKDVLIAESIISTPSPDSTLATLPGTTRLVVVSMRMKPAVRQFIGVAFGVGPELRSGDDRFVPRMMTASTGGSPASIVHVGRLDDPAASEPIRLPDRVDVRVPMSWPTSRLQLRVPRSVLDPSPTPGEPADVEGGLWLEEGQELWLRDIPVTRVEGGGA